MRAENQLRTILIDIRIVEHADQTPHKKGVQATVQFIYDKNATLTQHIENRRDERVESLGSLRFILKLKPCIPIWRLVVEHWHQKFIFFHTGVSNTTGLDQELIAKSFSSDGLDVFDTDISGRQEVANLRPSFSRSQHRRRKTVIHRSVCGKKQNTVRKPPKNRPQKLTVQLSRC